MENDPLFLNETLLIAAQNKQWDEVKQALAAGADVNAQDTRERTALYYACHHNAPTEVVRHLLEAGADARHKACENVGRAVHLCNFEILELLLSFGADINSTSGEWYDTPLCVAVEKDICPLSPDDKEDELYVQMIEFLLNAGANASAIVDTLGALDALEPDGITVLDVASEKLEEALTEFAEAYEEYCEVHGNTPNAYADDLQEVFFSHYYRYRAYARAYELLRNSSTNTTHDAKQVLEVVNVLTHRLRHVLRAFE